MRTHPGQGSNPCALCPPASRASSPALHARAAPGWHLGRPRHYRNRSRVLTPGARRRRSAVTNRTTTQAPPSLCWLRKRRSASDPPGVASGPLRVWSPSASCRRVRPPPGCQRAYPFGARLYTNKRQHVQLQNDKQAQHHGAPPKDLTPPMRTKLYAKWTACPYNWHRARARAREDFGGLRTPRGQAPTLALVVRPTSLPRRGRGGAVRWARCARSSEPTACSGVAMGLELQRDRGERCSSADGDLGALVLEGSPAGADPTPDTIVFFSCSSHVLLVFLVDRIGHLGLTESVTSG